MITIGSLSLDDSYAPYINIGYEYYKTSSQEIIGGVQIITVAGTVTVEDIGGQQTGSLVMSKLRGIRDLGRISECINVNIPGAEFSRGKISNVSIEQGSDPSWVNQGGFSIEIRGPLAEIPENSFDIVATDCVREFEQSESLQFGQESHGYFDMTYGSKSYVRYTASISVRCENFCKNNTSNSANLALGVLRKKYSCEPTNRIFNTYKSWKPFLENRSLQINTNGSVSFTCSMILVPPTAQYPDALIDISVENGSVYTSGKPARTKKISGTVTGLVSVPWTDLIDLNDSCLSSKYGAAYGIYVQLQNQFRDISSLSGDSIGLVVIPNCPGSGNSSNTASSSCGSIDTDSNNNSACMVPKSITVTKQYTDGIISFVHEWGPKNSDGNNDCENSGVQIETTIEIKEESPSLIEHVLPGKGTLIQNLACTTALRTIVTTSITSKDGSVSCPTSPPSGCGSTNSASLLVANLNSRDRLVSKTRSVSKNSSITKEEYIRCNS